MKNLFKALLKAQQSMGAASKDAANPYFKSKYADYGAVLEAVKGPLNDNGIVILQPHVFDSGKSFVKTTLTHAETGEAYESLTEVVCAKANDPQAFGSALTYARRYGLQSLLSLPTEDDDGNAGSGKTTKSAPAASSVVGLGTLTNVAVTEVSAAPATTPASRSGFRRVTPAALEPEAKGPMAVSDDISF